MKQVYVVVVIDGESKEVDTWGNSTIDQGVWGAFSRGVAYRFTTNVVPGVSLPNLLHYRMKTQKGQIL